MKLIWEREGFTDGDDHILMVKLDGESGYKVAAYLNTIGDWWHVNVHWAEEYDNFPDGARFLSLHAAKLFTRKHAIAAIIGGWKP